MKNILKVHEIFKIGPATQFRIGKAVGIKENLERQIAAANEEICQIKYAYATPIHEGLKGALKKKDVNFAMTLDVLLYDRIVDAIVVTAEDIIFKESRVNVEAKFFKEKGLNPKKITSMFNTACKGLATLHSDSKASEAKWEFFFTLLP